MTFRITGLDPAPFVPLYGLSDAELAARGVERHVVTRKPGFPERVEMRDAEPGETVLLLNYVHQPADTPYHASHAIFVREGATARYDREGELPEVMRVRPLSLRAFDDAGAMVDAALVEGAVVEPVIARFLADPRTAYVHAHYAVRGCYAGLITRTGEGPA